MHHRCEITFGLIYTHWTAKDAGLGGGTTLVVSKYKWGDGKVESHWGHSE